MVAILFLCTCTSTISFAAGKDSSIINALQHQKITIANDPIITSDTASCTIPFTRAGNLILIKMVVDKVVGNFILDTGAPGLVLNITYFRNYPTISSTDEEQGGITGTSTAVVKTNINKLTLGTIHYQKIEADLINLGHIENSKGVKIIGLLGMQMFKECEMIIDYEQNLIYLHHIKRKEANTYIHEMLKDTSVYSTFPITVTDNKVIVKTELAGKKLRFLIDCAAESNVLDSRLPNKIFDQVTINQRVLLSGSGSKKLEALYGNLQEFIIGNRVMANLPIIITNLEKTCLAFGGCIDGVLGFDFLSLHKTGFNFVTGKMYIWK